MIIGIDVGGTHADGVLLDGDRLVAKHKVSVDQQHLSESIITLLEELVPADRSRLERIHLSSTLCTNAIVTGSLDPVGMLIQAGPGLNPDFLTRSWPTWFLDGAIDHRGHIIRDPDPAQGRRGRRRDAAAGHRLDRHRHQVLPSQQPP